MNRRIIRTEDIIKEKRQPYYNKTNEEKLEEAYVNSDHPSTMTNATATVIYILVMLIGTIFNDRWLIYILATAIYGKFMMRHEIAKKEWDKKKTGGKK